MSNVTNVAVFPCGSEVGLEVSRSLKYSPHFKLFGWNSVSDYGRIEFANYLEDIPFYTDPDFIEKTRSYVAKLGIDFLIPGMDEVGFILKSNEEQLGCEVVYANIQTADVLRRKSSTYKRLQNLVATPTVYQKFEDANSDLPLFSKPDIGYGSKAIQKISTTADLKSALENTEILVTEYLPGPEYTIDCFSDAKSNVIFTEARTRQRIKMGISVSSTYGSIPAATDWAQKISTELEMQGAWFFQVKEDSEGKPKLMEIASRVAGSMSMYRSLGVNFIMLDLYQRMGKPVSILPNNYSQASLERALDCKVKLPLDFTTVYVDLDDCLVVDQQVNTGLLAFLYKSLNQGIKLVLLTRHDGNVEDYLKRFRLLNLFDEINHITDRTEAKSKYITDKSAIFIDDSFSERKDVYQDRKIPVFAPDAIDLLS